MSGTARAAPSQAALPWRPLPSTRSPVSRHHPASPDFRKDEFPFYWLAQASFLATQDGGSVSLSGSGKSDGRFRLMKVWLDHIRAFLRSGNQVPTHLWDELLKIKMRMSNEHDRTEDLPNGLLALFPGN